MSDKFTTISVRLDHDLAAKPKALADAEEHTASEYLRLPIPRHAETVTPVEICATVETTDTCVPGVRL